MNLRDTMDRCDRALALGCAVVLATLSAGAGTVLAAHAPDIPARIVETVVRTVPVMRPAPIQYLAKPGVSPADAARAALLAEHTCLTEALYYEARGEGEKGEKAVAEVIFDRLHDASYGNSICAVVHEGETRGQCQFSYACDGSRDKPRSKPAWHAAEILAARLLTGQERLDGVTGGATNYHADYVRPVWAGRLERTAQIGNHIFYRPQPVAMQVALRQSVW